MPGASFVLAPGVTVEDDGLVDIVGVRHRLNADALRVCENAWEPVAVDEVAVSLGLDESSGTGEDRAALEAFLVDLNGRGLISIEQSFVRETRARLGDVVAVVRRGTGSGAARVVRRYRATVGSILHACVEAHQVLMWAGVAALAIAIGLQLALGADEPSLSALGVRALAISVSGYFLAILATSIVHESGHLVAAYAVGGTVLGVTSRPGTVSVVFTAPSAAAARVVRAAGPLAGLVPGILVVLVVVFTPGALWAEAGMDRLRLPLVVAAATLALTQVVAFTPLTADGRGIWARTSSQGSEVVSA